MKKTANEIQAALITAVRGHGTEIIIPNYYYGMYEMDLFRLTNSQVVIEYEIKISRADYFNDFKKKRTYYSHRTWQEVKAGVKPVVTETNKHELIAAGKGNCNRFFFVVPEGLIKAEEVPAHAGLIYYSCPDAGYKRFGIVKNAKLLKAHKFDHDIYMHLATSLSYRESLHREKARQLRHDLKNLQNLFKGMPIAAYTEILKAYGYKEVKPNKIESGFGVLVKLKHDSWPELYQHNDAYSFNGRFSNIPPLEMLQTVKEYKALKVKQ